ncbi:unnamed protein product [Choristocarpus tenellus]
MPRRKDPEDTDGNVPNTFTWGSSEGGRLGYESGSIISQDVPRPVYSLGSAECCRAVRAAAGGRHSLFLLRNGKVLSCGVWDNGQLGCIDRPIVRVPSSTEEMIPVPKSLVPRGLVIHPLPVRGIGKVVVTELAASFASSFLLTTSGQVWSWGSGRYGCLGLGDERDRWSPECIPLFSERQGTPVAQLSAGRWHAICLTKAKTTFAWGRNNHGQLGVHSVSMCEPCPVQTPWNPQETPVQVSAGGEHCVALVDLLRSNLKRELVAFAWGHPGNGRLGWYREPTHASPIEVEELTEMLHNTKCKLSSLSAGGSHTLALLGSGELAAWGAGGYGQLGDGHMWDRPKAVKVSGLNGARQASAGERHSVALVSDGGSRSEVWGWGFNRWGEIGCSGCEVKLQPQHVAGLTGCMVERVEAGERHTIAMTNGRARRVKDLPEYKGFINAYRSGGLAVYNALQQTMVTKGLNPMWLDTPKKYFSGQPGMQDAECRPDSVEVGMEWCMDMAPKGKDLFDGVRGGLEVVYICRPCRLERACLACVRICHTGHCIEPILQLRNKSKPCDCSATQGMCACKWSPMREHFRHMSGVASGQGGSNAGSVRGRGMAGRDGTLDPSELRELLQVVRGGAAFVTSENVEDGIMELTGGGELERLEYLCFERWYEVYFAQIDEAMKHEGV